MMVDYAFYRAAYAGKLIPTDTDWMAAELSAVHWLQGHIDLDKDPLTHVKLAICAAAEIYYARKQCTPGVQSENTDGYAVTYDQRRSIEAELLEAVNPYIGNLIKSVRWC